MITQVLFLSLRALEEAQTSVIKGILTSLYKRHSRLLLDIQVRAGPHLAETKVEHEGNGGGGTQLGLSFFYMFPATCFTQSMIFTFVFISSNAQRIQIYRRESSKRWFHPLQHPTQDW